MSRRQRDPEREQVWRGRLARWQSSGQTVRAFCTAERIPESAFYFWRGELRGRRSSPSKPRALAPTFVPVTVLSVLTGVVEVCCPSGHVVSLPIGDASVLRQLFAALGPEAAC